MTCAQLIANGGFENSAINLCLISRAAQAYQNIKSVQPASYATHLHKSATPKPLVFKGATNFPLTLSDIKDLLVILWVSDDGSFLQRLIIFGQRTKSINFKQKNRLCTRVKID